MRNGEFRLFTVELFLKLGQPLFQRGFLLVLCGQLSFQGIDLPRQDSAFFRVSFKRGQLGIQRILLRLQVGQLFGQRGMLRVGFTQLFRQFRVFLFLDVSRRWQCRNEAFDSKFLRTAIRLRFKPGESLLLFRNAILFMGNRLFQRGFLSF